MTIFLWLITKKEIRKSIINIISCLLNKTFIRMYFEVFFYTIFIIIILYKIEFWEFIYTKGTIFWFLFTSFYLCFKIADSGGENNIFKSILKDSISFFLVFTYLLNVYTFPIIWELIIISLATFVSILIAYTETFKENDPNGVVNRFMSNISVVIGFFILFYLVREMILDHQEFLSISSMKSLFLPLVLTISFLPYLIYLQYNILFNSIVYVIDKNNELKIYEKIYFRIKLVIYAGLEKKKLNKFKQMNFSKLWGLEDINSIKNIFDNVN